MWPSETEQQLIRLRDLTEEIIRLLLEKNIEQIEELLVERGKIIQHIEKIGLRNLADYQNQIEEIMAKDQRMIELANTTRDEIARQMELTRQTRKAVRQYEGDNNFIPDAIFFDRKK